MRHMITRAGEVTSPTEDRQLQAAVRRDESKAHLVRSEQTVSRRSLASGGAAALLLAGCEQLGLKAHIVTSMTVNGKTTVREREAKNWGEFEEAMGEVATDFSSFAKEVGTTTAELASKLIDVPPPGQIRLGDLDPSLVPFQGDLRYDYLKVASMKPDPEYDFRYVQIGVPEYDAFFRGTAEMYATAYQLVETGRHIHLAAAEARGIEPEGPIASGAHRVPKVEVENALAVMSSSPEAAVGEAAKDLDLLWTTAATLGVQLVQKTIETVQAGTALVASAPTQLTNPRLLLHLDLIVKGLTQSVALVEDTGALLVSVVG
jgi:hypothetical protein